jgi:pimeloyl-ACP methyl ester carboxylesterase
MTRVRRLLRAALHLAAAVLVVVLAGASLQAWAEGEERRRFPPPGELVDTGGGRLVHLRTWGDHHASPAGPTVVLSVSANMPSSAWAWVARELARDFRVVAFDRPGMGWSTGGGGLRDARSAAEALSMALDTAEIQPPFVVVGHSYGGLAARAFTGVRGNDVTALVLVDSTVAAGTGSGFAAYYRWRAWLGHLGVYRLFPPQSAFRSLPAEEADAAYAASLWTSHLDASADELEAWVPSVEQVRAVDLSGVPLLVVSGRGTDEQVAVQREIAALSERGKFVYLPLGHVSMLTVEAEAALVAAEIRRFVASLSYPTTRR